MPGADRPYVGQIFYLELVYVIVLLIFLQCRVVYELPQEVTRPVIPVYSDFRGRITVTEQ